MANIIELNPAALIVSERYQARKTAGKQPLSELADSIAAQGLLQNLVVTKAKKRGAYEVVAGGRRLQAIHMLIADGRWPKDQTINAVLVDGKHALEASITENVQREAMHPADEFESFAKLLDQGMSIEDVAARHAVTPQIVKRRMRLASVAPELIDAYRADETTLETLMAFSVTEDQQRQRDVWAGLGEWERRQPHIVRNRLTADEVTANDGVARFVGLDAYRAAGGRCYRDLFASEDDDRGIYLQDRAIIETLALEKLASIAETVRAEGWAWVDVVPDQECDILSRCGRVWAQDRELTDAEQTRLDELNAQRAEIAKRMDALLDDDDEGGDEWHDLDEQSDQLYDLIRGIHDNAKQWPSDLLKIAGAIVTVSYSGTEEIHRGLIRPEDRQAAQAVQNEDGAARDRVALPKADTRPVHSERLVRQLTANKVGIVAATLASKPDLALAVLVARLAAQVLDITGGYGIYSNFGIGVRLDQENLDHHAPDFAASKAGQELARMRQHWLDLIHNEKDSGQGAVLDWAMNQQPDTLRELLAYLVASSVQGVAHQEPTRATDLDRLAEVVCAVPAQWWEPTADSYLSHVSKDRIIAAVTEGAGAEAAAPLAKMKKAQAVEAAEQALRGRNWMPEVLRIRGS